MVVLSTSPDLDRAAKRGACRCGAFRARTCHALHSPLRRGSLQGPRNPTIWELFRPLRSALQINVKPARDRHNCAWLVTELLTRVARMISHWLLHPFGNRPCINLKWKNKQSTPILKMVKVVRAWKGLSKHTSSEISYTTVRCASHLEESTVTVVRMANHSSGGPTFQL